MSQATLNIPDSQFKVGDKIIVNDYFADGAKILYVLEVKPFLYRKKFSHHIYKLAASMDEWANDFHYTKMITSDVKKHAAICS